MAECYALWLDPTDATNDFRIVSIEIVDGEPKVEWVPKVNRWTGAEIQTVLKGAEKLDGEWKSVEGATAAEKSVLLMMETAKYKGLGIIPYTRVELPPRGGVSRGTVERRAHVHRTHAVSSAGVSVLRQLDGREVRVHGRRTQGTGAFCEGVHDALLGRPRVRTRARNRAARFRHPNLCDVREPERLFLQHQHRPRDGRALGFYCADFSTREVGDLAVKLMGLPGVDLEDVSHHPSNS